MRSAPGCAPGSSYRRQRDRPVEHLRRPHEYREIYLKQYKRSLQLPDARDWDIIESLCHDVGIEDFDETDIQRIEKILEPTTDEEFEQLAVKGKIKAEDVEAAKANEAARLEQIYELATTIVCQLSNGQTRKITEAESDAIYTGFWEYLPEFEDFEDQMVCLPAEGYHRSIFINTDGFDYISIPTHKWEQGRIAADAESIDAFSPDAGKPKRRRRPKVVEGS